MAIQAQLCPEKVGFALSGSQDFMLENGCGGLVSDNHFCSTNYLLPQHQPQYQQQMKNQALFFDTNSFLTPALRNSNLGGGGGGGGGGIDNAKLEPLGGFQFQATFQDKERQEVDRFIRAQNARLRVLLHGQRKRQMVAVMKKLEARAAAVMRQKDEEIAKATTRWMELENLLRRLEMENQVWQKVAREKEAMVVSLNNALEEMRERGSACSAESCCGGMVEDETMGASSCRVCKSGNSCVVFLPCRHLCSCKQCQVLVDSCPVCGSPKKSSIEVLIS